MASKKDPQNAPKATPPSFSLEALLATPTGTVSAVKTDIDFPEAAHPLLDQMGAVRIARAAVQRMQDSGELEDAAAKQQLSQLNRVRVAVQDQIRKLVPPANATYQCAPQVPIGRKVYSASMILTWTVNADSPRTGCERGTVQVSPNKLALTVQDATPQSLQDGRD